MSLLNVFYFLFGLFLLNIVLYLFLLNRVMHLLKVKYSEKYKDLREPSLIYDLQNPFKQIRFLRFVFSKDQIFTADGELRRLRTITLTLSYFTIGIFFVLIILFFYFYLSGHPDFQYQGG